MPTYRGTSGSESVMVTTPETLSDEQLTGIVSGALSIPGVTVERSGKSEAPTAPVLPDVKPPPPTGPVRPPPDFMGRIKAHLTQEPEPGSPRDNPLARGIRSVGGAVLPGSVPDLVTDAALFSIPGAGVVRSTLRGAAATGAGTATAGLMGESMEDQAVKSGISSAAGEGGGAVARAATRAGLAGLSRAKGAAGTWLGNKFGAGNTVVNLGETAGGLVPAFKGASPRETISRILDGSGVRQLGEDYGAAVEGVLRQHGNPVLTLPALDRLGIPSTMTATEINLFLKSRGRALFDEAGKMKRSKDAVVEGYWLDKAQEQFQQALTQHLPKAATDGMAAARDMFARGKLIQKLMSEGRETMTDAQVARLMDQGRLNEPLLERTFKRMGGKLKDRFSPDEYAGLEQSIRRGEKDPLAFSREGKASKPHLWMGSSKLPVPHFSIPKAPVRIGKPEEVSDVVARIFRLLSAGGVQGVLDE